MRESVCVCVCVDQIISSLLQLNSWLKDTCFQWPAASACDQHGRSVHRSPVTHTVYPGLFR